MSPKNREQLQNELDMQDELRKLRKESDEKYAIRLVQTIVFSAIGTIALAVLSALIALVVRKGS